MTDDDLRGLSDFVSKPPEPPPHAPDPRQFARGRALGRVVGEGDAQVLARDSALVRSYPGL
jgi:hypothetical protein